jgi:hypothetical protein
VKYYIHLNDLHDNIRILGYMDRVEQLCIMKHSIAIIQPSLFEGWSTVVEDAKALNKYVLLSNLDVHREQISINASFFDPFNKEDLKNQAE